MAGILAKETHVPMKLKVPDGTEPPVGLAGYRALDDPGRPNDPSTPARPQHERE